MNTEWIEPINNFVLVGTGAFIAAVSAWVLSKVSHKQHFEKEVFQNRQRALEIISIEINRNHINMMKKVGTLASSLKRESKTQTETRRDVLESIDAIVESVVGVQSELSNNIGVLRLNGLLGEAGVMMAYSNSLYELSKFITSYMSIQVSDFEKTEADLHGYTDQLKNQINSFFDQASKHYCSVKLSRRRWWQKLADKFKS